MRFSRKLTALSIALVVCGTAACTDLEGTWSLLSFTIYPPSGAPVEMKGEGTLSFDDFGYVMMTLDADAASAALLAEAGIPMEKNRFFTWGKTIVDKRNKTLKYVKYVFEGQVPRPHGRADGRRAPVLLERDRQYPDADDEGRGRQASVRGQMAEAVRHRPRARVPQRSTPRRARRAAARRRR